MDCVRPTIVAVMILLTFCPAVYAVSYRNTGMTCQQIGDCPETVAYQKQMKDGVTLHEALDGLLISLSGGGFKSTEAALAEIIEENLQASVLSQFGPQRD